MVMMTVIHHQPPQQLVQQLVHSNSLLEGNKSVFGNERILGKQQTTSMTDLSYFFYFLALLDHVCLGIKK